MPQATDEDGYIWNVDAAGNPIGAAVGRVGSNAPASGGTVFRKPVEPPKPREAPSGYEWTANGQLRLIPGGPADPTAKPDDGKTSKEENAAAQRIANLRALEAQIARTRELFNAGPGATTGMAGLADLLPLPANRDFDTAGAGLADIGTAAFKVPGMGSQSDADAARFVKANQPQASDYDSTIEEKLRTVEQRLALTLKELGQEPMAAAQPRQAAPASGGVNKSALPGAGGGNGGGPRSVTGENYFVPADDINAGVVELFRQGKDANAVNAWLQSQGRSERTSPEAVQQWRNYQRAGGKADPSSRAGDWKQRTMLQQIAGGPTAAAFNGAVKGASAGLSMAPAAAFNSAMTGQSFDDAYRATDANYDLAAAANPGASMAGEVAGGIGGMMMGGAALNASRAGRAIEGLGVKLGMTAEQAAARIAKNKAMAAFAGDLGYGATYGATSEPDAPVTGGLLGAAGGFAGNRIGAGIARGAGAMTRGVVDPAVQAMQARGIPMTGGQMMGGVAKKIEDGLESVPGLGSMVRARRTEGLQAFNRAALDEAGQPINAQMTDIGAAGLQQLDDATGLAYGRALDGVTVNSNDPAFMGDMAAAVQRGQGLPQPMAGNADYSLRTRVGESFQPNGDLSGRDFQQSVRGLRGDARAVRSQPYGMDFGAVTNDAEGALEGLLQRQSPGTLPAYRAANESFRRGSVITDALNTGVNQVDEGAAMFTPAQLARASTTNTKAFGGKRAAATGNRPFAALTDAAQEVLPSKLPNSGTADRAAIMALIPGIGAGAGYAGAGGEGAAGGTATGLGALGIMSLLNTRGGARMLQAALLQRPQSMQRVGGMLVNNDRIAGAAGRAIGAPLLLQYGQ